MKKTIFAVAVLALFAASSTALPVSAAQNVDVAATSNSVDESTFAKIAIVEYGPDSTRFVEIQYVDNIFRTGDLAKDGSYNYTVDGVVVAASKFPFATP
ncbi:hypothetical protein [Lacticaseibacillus sharpeae]|uniref:Uncharacterized protein n=1 Tax=Lacticaseibacillus sharpeae JCM 1186 = DSM 20505 TaxID=1291052 RepID=A0A0R1ZJH0_9LACO|nr:hypothetical protein [Lacticaseibacillus sharpeae]KRM55037.1 hypothetical protein FC18_GL001745 [Lacticaseibacillus sharpeae JCM 1186 = DSM 20505]